ncbi:MAG: FHA domain-containing protein [Gemmataceae bacterium]
MKFYLIVAKGSKKGMPVPITVDLFLIGSDPICQLRARSLGPKQCALVTRDRNVFIRDMSSGEPTIVNGDVLPPGVEWPLHKGDLLSVGALEFMIQFHEKALSQKDLEEWAAKCLDINSDRSLFDEDADEFHKPTTASGAAASIIDKLTVQRGVIMGRLRIGRESGVTTVRFNDAKLVEPPEVDLIRKELCGQLNHHNLRVLLDFKNVKRLSTAGVAMVGDFCRWLKPFGSTVAFCRIRAELRSMMDVFKMDNIPYFHDKKSALIAEW